MFLKRSMVVLAWLFANFLFAQTGTTFPVDNAVWTVGYVGFGGPITFEKFCITGDTLIKSKTYKKIQHFRFTDSMIYDIKQMPPIRDDGQKWYISIPDSANEQVLYDFTAKRNDTITTFCYMGLAQNLMPAKVVVDSIDSIFIYNTYRKRWVVNSLGGIKDIWVEGIGSLNGLFYPAESSFDNDHFLLCFWEEDTLLYNIANSYPGYETMCDNAPITALPTITATAKFSIYPNPANDWYVLDMSGLKRSKYPYSFITFDALGRKVSQIRNIQIGINRFETDGLAPGYYFYHIVSNGEIFQSGKFAVQ